MRTNAINVSNRAVALTSRDSTRQDATGSRARVATSMKTSTVTSTQAKARRSPSCVIALLVLRSRISTSRDLSHGRSDAEPDDSPFDLGLAAAGIEGWGLRRRGNDDHGAWRRRDLN